MNGVERILVVEDDEGMRLSCRQALEQVGHAVLEAGSVREAEPLLLREVFDLVITDLRMPHGGGQEVLRLVKQVSPEVPVVLITAYPSVESAIEAFRGGVTDYLLKPFTSEQLIETVDSAVATRRAGERAAIHRRLGENVEAPEIVGGSEAIRSMLAEIRRVAALDASVLVLGETGSGKELVSRSVHRFSRRSAGPFTVLNCAAIPENLFEAELFGYERGAFTGAMATKRGLMEEAHHGSLFLDEVAELPPAAQAKLLRCLEEKAVRRLGSVSPRPVDTRVIAATHKDLRAEVEAGRFREDLYYRLAVLDVRVPPLRERPEDIAPLAIRILDKLRQENERPMVGFSDEALARLGDHAWPGNVRELQNVLQRAFARAEGSLIRASDLPLAAGPPAAATNARGRDRALSEFERSYVTAALARHEGNVTHTARELGVHRTTLQRMMKKLAIAGD
jgi:two-component system, NtrC family, response regulator HydG